MYSFSAFSVLISSSFAFSQWPRESMPSVVRSSFRAAIWRSLRSVSSENRLPDQQDDGGGMDPKNLAEALQMQYETKN